jgi:HTH-type transcriptional regulator / antitoxin MqsA
MKCPVCGMAELVHDIRDLPYTYKNEFTSIPNVEGNFCPACGDVVLGAEESRRVSAQMLEFNKQVNAAIIDPNFIARTRKKLALDQQEASRLFGGGVNAFSRYETGKTKPPLSLVRLFQLLDRHPDLLVEIQSE